MENFEASVDESEISEPSQQAEPSVQPQAPAEPVQQAQTALTREEINEIIKASLQEQLNPIKSEFGKFRKTQSEFDQFRNSQKTQTPASVAQMSPEQKRETLEFLEAILGETKFGKQLEEVQSGWSEFQTERQRTQAFESIRSIAGDKFEDLDPFMGQIYAQAQAEAQKGNQNAETFLYELYNTTSGKRVLVDMARDLHRQALETKSKEAQAKAADSRKKAGTTLTKSGTESKPSVDLEAIQSIKDPAERLKKARELKEQLA